VLLNLSILGKQQIIVLHNLYVNLYPSLSFQQEVEHQYLTYPT